MVSLQKQPKLELKMQGIWSRVWMRPANGSTITVLRTFFGIMWRFSRNLCGQEATLALRLPGNTWKNTRILSRTAGNINFQRTSIRKSGGYWQCPMRKRQKNLPVPTGFGSGCRNFSPKPELHRIIWNRQCWTTLLPKRGRLMRQLKARSKTSATRISAVGMQPMKPASRH